MRKKLFVFAVAVLTAACVAGASLADAATITE